VTPRDVMRNVTGYGNAPVTGYGHAGRSEDVADSGAVPVSRASAFSREEREQVRRAQNAERQRRFRRRRAARRAGAARQETQDRKEARAPLQAEGDGGVRHSEELISGSLMPAAQSGRDRGAEFVVWISGYPRQEREIPARQAWMAESDLPPLALMLERLAVQKAARPDAYYWPAADRYVREKRWRDEPPPAPPRAGKTLSVWAQLRAMGSDDGRRQRLREISAQARFDPFDPGGSRG
jgi:hypothetical protein